MELREVPTDQKEDPKEEEAERNLLEEEQATHAYQNSHQHNSESIRWKSRHAPCRSDIPVRTDVSLFSQTEC